MSAPATPGPPALAPSGSLDEALGILFSLGVGALHARRCSLYLRADDGASLALHHETGLAAGAEARYIPGEGTIAGLVMRSRVPLLVQDVGAYPALPLHPERYSTRSFISVPILVENEARGVLNVAEREDGAPFSERDLENAEMVARSMATVLHSDLLTQRAVNGSEVDPVTGLYNARHFAKRLAQEVERSQRADLPLSLLLLDVTCYGELAARVDAQTAGLLMRCVGEMVAQTIRQADVLARRLDNELAVLLPSTPLDRARRVARSIVREVLHEKLPATLRYDLEDLTISIGLAALDTAMDAEALVRGAERALAQARLHGTAVVAAPGEELGGGMRRPPSQHKAPAPHGAIATALRLGIPYLSDPADAASAAAVRLLSQETARTYACFPVAFEAGTLTLAMADPGDAGAIQAISQLTNMAIYPVASPREKILQAIATLMSERKPRPEGRVRLHLPPTADRRFFVQQVYHVAAICDELKARDLTVEGTIAVRSAVGMDRATLVVALTTAPTLDVQRDKRDAALLHVSMAKGADDAE